MGLIQGLGSPVFPGLNNLLDHQVTFVVEVLKKQFLALGLLLERIREFLIFLQALAVDLRYSLGNRHER